ncbi:hypothetical protein [Photobacterium damselae]|uniref:Uncharacterized protein n=1 Tax=Photobacterium damselae TaxID=38293 RepID=A0ACD3T167_PHODM|nr:hypothetical protein [Photobacterium damselae]RDL29726.1 hypothetical protein BC461_12220 [Photobacterium damselae]TMX46730.1 hypothetical protein DA099_15730 [Photobacterium damselae]TMX64262.1 hypothetical protein DA090_14845 [Photobacterium damselae]TMX75595.1 hypothetical protein DA092_08375 [Photobacterium damselae]
MRKLAHFELKSVLNTLDHAEFMQVYDFSNLVACGISPEAIRFAYRYSCHTTAVLTAPRTSVINLDQSMECH